MAQGYWERTGFGQAFDTTMGKTMDMYAQRRADRRKEEKELSKARAAAIAQYKHASPEARRELEARFGEEVFTGAVARKTKREPMSEAERERGRLKGERAALDAKGIPAPPIPRKPRQPEASPVPPSGPQPRTPTLREDLQLRDFHRAQDEREDWKRFDEGASERDRLSKQIGDIKRNRETDIATSLEKIRGDRRIGGKINAYLDKVTDRDLPGGDKINREKLSAQIERIKRDIEEARKLNVRGVEGPATEELEVLMGIKSSLEHESEEERIIASKIADSIASEGERMAAAAQRGLDFEQKQVDIGIEDVNRPRVEEARRRVELQEREDFQEADRASRIAGLDEEVAGMDAILQREAMIAAAESAAEAGDTADLEALAEAGLVSEDDYKRVTEKRIDDDFLSKGSLADVTVFAQAMKEQRARESANETAIRNAIVNQLLSIGEVDADDLTPEQLTLIDRAKERLGPGLTQETLGVGKEAWAGIKRRSVADRKERERAADKAADRSREAEARRHRYKAMSVKGAQIAKLAQQKLQRDIGDDEVVRAAFDGLPEVRKYRDDIADGIKAGKWNEAEGATLLESMELGVLDAIGEERAESYKRSLEAASGLGQSVPISRDQGDWEDFRTKLSAWREGNPSEAEVAAYNHSMMAKLSAAQTEIDMAQLKSEFATSKEGWSKTDKNWMLIPRTVPGVDGVARMIWSPVFRPGKATTITDKEVKEMMEEWKKRNAVQSKTARVLEGTVRGIPVERPANQPPAGELYPGMP